MNAVDRARLAYAGPSQPVRTARDAEYDVFARVTHRLKSAAAGESFPKLALAIYENRRLWTALAGDVAGEGNGLPSQLRAQIVSLNKFTYQHSSKVLEGNASPDVLIEINTSVMRGLRRDGGGGS